MILSTNSTITYLTFLLIFLISIHILLQPPKTPLLSKMSTPPYSNTSINPFERLHVTQNSNGTLTRPAEFFPVVPPSTVDASSLSLSKDVIINQEKNTWVRIFLPRNVSRKQNGTNNNEKLPIVVFAHGGGFILCSAGSPVFHEFGDKVASSLAALIVSVEYRLAPEHRLPAAYDDVLEALSWVKDGKDPWINNYGDFSKCILMGESAGGNIVYHTGLKVAINSDDFKPLIINGLILIQPYFGGLDRTKSEVRLVNDVSIPLVVNDLMWDLSLPLGSNRGHEYCDPLAGGGSKDLDRVRDLGWWVGVVACKGDPLFDREEGLVKLLEQRGVRVRVKFDKGGHHGMFVSDSTKMEELIEFVKDLFWL